MNKTVFETRRHFICSCLIIATTTILGINNGYSSIEAETLNPSEYTEANESVKHVVDVVYNDKLMTETTEAIIDAKENVENPDIASVSGDNEAEVESEYYTDGTVITDDWTESDDVDIEDIVEQRDDELLAKYSYALYDDSGARNDINGEILNLAENLCAQQGIDPNLFLAIVMTESQGHANAKNKHSTATGFGQLLKSTGKWCYEDLLGYGKGTYYHDLAYNPELNVAMTISLLGELKREYNGNMYRAVQHYRGKNDISDYLGEMDRWLNKGGLDVSYYV